MAMMRMTEKNVTCVIVMMAEDDEVGLASVFPSPLSSNGLSFVGPPGETLGEREDMGLPKVLLASSVVLLYVAWQTEE